VPSRSASNAWLAGRDGHIREIALDTGVVLRTRQVDDTVTSAAGDPAGHSSVLIGVKRNWIVGLDKTRLTSFPLPGCTAARPTFSPDGASFYVPCIEGPVLVVDTASGRTLRRIPVPDQGARAVALAPTPGHLLIGGDGGRLYDLTVSSGRLKRQWTSPCGESILGIAVSPAANSFLSVGEGAGLPACTQIRVRDSGGNTFNAAATNRTRCRLRRGA
jgi:hypothetical protein